MKHTSKDIAEILLELRAVKLSPKNPFTWASGIQSPIYCDNRITLSHPEERNFIARSLLTLVENWDNIDVIAGVATAGIPYASILAHMTEKPLIYVRSSNKKHGRKNVIEGAYTTGQRVIVVEDLISTGGSSLEAVAQLRAQNLDVMGVIAIFSYQLEAAVNNFREQNISYKSLSNYTDLIQQAVELNYISGDDLATLEKWNSSPQNWQNE